MIIVLPILIFSCSALRLGQKTDVWNTPEEQVEIYNKSISGLRTFQGEGILLFESLKINERFPVRVLYKSPDSLFVKLEGPLGIDIALFFLDKNSYLLYLPRDQVSFSGEISSMDINDLLYDLDLEEIEFDRNVWNPEEFRMEVLGFFQGGLPVESDLFTSLSFNDSTGKTNMYKVADNSSEMIYQFSKNKAELEKLIIKDEHGNTRIEKTYKWYRRSKGLKFPKYTKFDFLEEKRRITIKYTNIKVNINLKPKLFHIDIPIGN